jgi:transposase
MSGLRVDTIKAKAEIMFVRDGVTGREISRRLKVSEQSVSRWRKQGEWNRKRAEHLNGATQQAISIGIELKAVTINEFIEYLHERDISLSEKVSYHAISFINRK